MSEKSVVPGSVSAPSEASKDPLSKMVDIAKDPDLSDSDKSALIAYAQKKFINRRRMAYIALITIVASLVLIFVAAFVDGTRSCTEVSQCVGILSTISDNETLIIWIEGFLASIVAAYYGISGFRPSS